MWRRVACLIVLLGPVTNSVAADATWSVVNPFRFYRHERLFQVHRAAYDEILREVGGQIPSDIVARIERRLNRPDCTDSSPYEVCFATAGQQWDRSRLGWAATGASPLETCYGPQGTSGRYSYTSHCYRDDGVAQRTEDYIKPAAHAVRVDLSQELKTNHGDQLCQWSWRKAGSAANSKRIQPCGKTLLIQQVPYPEGSDVSVKLPNGPEVSIQVKVRDLLIVGLGDSFASGEGNPDRPVSLHPSHGISYDGQPWFYPIRATKPLVYPDEMKGDVAKAWLKKVRAGWLSPDCHRSQYSYQFRVALQLGLEDPHRAVTLVHLACTGAEATTGIFAAKGVREFDEGRPITVRSQLNQLLDLVCEERKGITRRYDMTAPYRWGKDRIDLKTYFVQGCTKNRLKRPIDLVMLSLGGNDIGFSSLVGHTIIDNAGEIAEVATLLEIFTQQRITFGPVEAYLDILDERMEAVRKAFRELLGVEPSRVIQTSYERLQVDEAGNLCRGTIGLDVHRKFAFRDDRLQEVDAFAARFLDRLACIAEKQSGCPDGLATGEGTGFRFVTRHQTAFAGRGICALDPDGMGRERADLTVPRLKGSAGFSPYIPSRYMPYAPRHRLFVTPDDAFMTANSHEERLGCKPFDGCNRINDKVQLGFAALYSGAFHRTAQAHAIVADAVMPDAREIVAVTP